MLYTATVHAENGAVTLACGKGLRGTVKSLSIGLGSSMLATAINLAIANPVTDLPRMAAVIMNRRRVVSYGLNSRRSHPLAKRFGRNEECFLLHAEIAALVNAREPVGGCDIYVARVLKSGMPAMAKPCRGCARALDAFGISGVFWTEREVS